LIDLAAGRQLEPLVADHAELVKSAMEHRMQGLLWTAVRREEIRVPRRTELVLAGEFMRTKTRHTRFWEAYAEISERLGAEEIEFAAIKGVTAEERWFDELGERPSRDVDLWISPLQMDRFGEALRVLCPDHPLVHHVQSLVDRGYLQGIDFPWHSGVSVDLHGDLVKLGLPAQTSVQAWSLTEISVFRGLSLRVVAPSTAVFSSCVHLNVDMFSRLIGACELKRIIDRSHVNISEAEELATSDGIETPFASSGRRVQQILGDDLGFRGPRGISALVWRMAWPERACFEGTARAEGLLRRRFIQFFSSGSWMALLQLHAIRLFPPDALLKYVFPEARGPYGWRVFWCRIHPRLFRR
jgi:hypothetical protein